MIVGVLAKTINTNFIRDIVNLTQKNNYYWIATYSEGFNIKTANNILPQGKYNYNDLTTELDCDFFFVALELFALPKVGSEETIVNSFKDFICSNYDMAIFVVDKDYYAVFAKQESLVFSVEELAKKRGCSNITILTEKNAELYYGL